MTTNSDDFSGSHEIGAISGSRFGKTDESGK